MTIDAGEAIRLIRAGRHAELEQQARAAVASDPGSGIAWKALSVALSAQGKDAMAALLNAAARLPQDAEAHANLAQALRARGRLREAIASYTRALVLDPGSAVLHHGLGNALLASGLAEAAAASYRCALQISPDLAEAHCNLGNALRSLGRLPEAHASYARAIELNPGFALAFSNMADVLRDLGQFTAAAASCRRAIELAPQLASAHNSLGNALMDLGLHGEAALSYRRAVALEPGFAGAKINLGLALRQQGQADEAQGLCRAVLAQFPDSVPALVLLAELLTDGGDFAAAEDSLRHAIAVDPASAEAQAGIAYLRRMTPADAPWAQAALALAGHATPRQEVYLRFALGKYHDDVGDPAQAFANFARAHALAQAQGGPHDRRLVTARVDELILAQDAGWLRRTRSDSNPAPLAVLILGMPRSGTSLAEQILASHPDVFGAGELPYWGAVAAAASDATLAQLGNGYLRQLAAAAGASGRTAARVIDKMPANFWHAGLVHAALPNARIIHMQRDPIDTCLSIFFQNFRNAYPFAHDLADLAHYYREYRRLMQHWRAALPRGVMLDVPYEGLIDDTEGWSRSMLQFIGLPWDARCLEFSQVRRQVLTSSKWQVRQKISRASIGRWRPYERFIGPLLELSAAAP